jgi:DNA-binding transcriptional MerR regulator
MYRQRDVENVLHIKKLLYDQGFTIAGARQHLKDESRSAQKQSGLPFPKRNSSDQLKKVRQGLQEILGILTPRRK